jgi:hypothetical protein
VKQINSAVSDKIHLTEFRPKETRWGKSKLVWVIGTWNLDIVRYLLFGAWNFLNAGTQP